MVRTMKTFLLVMSIAVAVVALPVAASAKPASKEDLMKLMELLQVDKQVRVVSDMVSQMLQQQLAAGGDTDGAEEAEIVREEINKAYDEILPELLLEYANIWGKYLTEEDVKELLVVYSNPTVQKTITIMPEVAKDAMPLGQKTAARMMEVAGPTLKTRLQALKEKREAQQKDAEPQTAQ